MIRAWQRFCAKEPLPETLEEDTGLLSEVVEAMARVHLGEMALGEMAHRPVWRQLWVRESPR